MPRTDAEAQLPEALISPVRIYVYSNEGGTNRIPAEPCTRFFEIFQCATMARTLAKPFSSKALLRAVDALLKPRTPPLPSA